MDPSPSESELISCTLHLRELFRDSQGDVPKLRDMLLKDFRSKKYTASVFHKILEENIAASKRAGYSNKEKVFNFLKTCIEAEEAKASMEETQASQYTKPSHAALETADEVRESLSAHHAPKFVDDELVKAADSHSTLEVTAPDTFIDASGAAAFLYPSPTQNSKKKSERKEAQRRAGAVAAKLGAHLAQHGWAVCDNFVPPELVRRIRIEVRPARDRTLARARRENARSSGGGRGENTRARDLPAPSTPKSARRPGPSGTPPARRPASAHPFRPRRPVLPSATNSGARALRCRG